MDFSDDILQPMSVDQMAEYRARCASNLPTALRAHHFLLLQERWIRLLAQSENQTLATDISDRLKFKFYIHRSGQVDNCTFVAMTETATHPDDYAVVPFTLQPNCAELNESLRQTKRIKWGLSPLFPMVHSDHMDALNDLVRKNDYELNKHFTEEFVCVWLPKEIATIYEYEIPDDVYAAPLEDCHADIINDFWSHRSSRSRKYVWSQLRLNRISIGLFDKKTNEIRAWVLTNYRNAIGQLYTMESGRRRGFGKLLVQMWCKEFVKLENAHPTAYIAKTNQASRKLFESLCFKIFRDSWWLQLNTFKDN